MSSVVAIVKSIVGQVVAVSPEGIRRVLIEGDRLFAGEQVLTGPAGAVTLELPDGRTLDMGRGSCRDFAVLFVEAARLLGFGARVVSGYLFNPALADTDSTTHAWAEVFVPGAGWITFDPTNRSVGGFNLIPVAVGRAIAQVMPVAGSFVGSTDSFLDMTVAVSVTA